MKPLYHFPRSSQTMGVTHLKILEKYLCKFFFTFFYFLTSAIKHSCCETNFKARKVYPLFMMLDFGSFLLFLSLSRAFMTCSSVVIVLTIIMNIYSINTLRVRSNNIFSYFQGLLIQLNMSMEFANCTKSVKDGLHPSPGVKSSDSTLITFLLDSK